MKKTDQNSTNIARRANVNDLKPKANKLMSFITNWKLAQPDKNIELCQSIQKLIKTGKFPNTIRTFFKLPEFKELLKTMEGGKLFHTHSQEMLAHEEDLSVRIYHLQILIEVFHRLTHIDYNKEKIKDPLVHVKVVSQNLLEYIECADLLILLEGPIVQEIYSSLFQSIQHFAAEIKKIITQHVDTFTPELVKLAEEPILEIWDHLQSANSDAMALLKRFGCRVHIELNIDPKLKSTLIQSNAIGLSVAHKLVNQMQSLQEKKRQFNQQNPPYYTPVSLRDKIFLELQDSESDLNLLSLFEEKRFSLLEAKESGLTKKTHHIQDQFYLIKESLFTLTQKYSSFVPDHFTHYLNTLHTFDLTHPSLRSHHLLTQLELGFYSVQYDYLMELLTESTPCTSLPASLIEQIYSALPTILWLLEAYYRHKPLVSFVTIKKILSPLLSPKPLLKENLQTAFQLLLPDPSHSFDEIEIYLSELIEMLKKLALPHSSIEYELLRERIRNLSQVDLPSYPQTWSVIGEVLGLFFILLSQFDPHFSTHFKSLQKTLLRHPFLQVLSQ